MGNIDTVFEDKTDTLKDIVLTKEGKKPQKEVEFVYDKQKCDELAEPVRRHVIHVLRQGIDDTQTTEDFNEETNERIIRQRIVKRNIMSVVEIVKASVQSDCCEAITKNQLYHHIPKLIDSGYVIKYGTVTTGKRTTDYYRRTAKGFMLLGADPSADEEHLRCKISEGQEKIASIFDLNIPPEHVKELSELWIKSALLQTEYRVKIAKMIRGDVADPEVLELFEWMLNIYSMGSDEYVQIQRKMQKILFPDT
ncbi:MAG: hypothetical protein KAU89_02150 [Candidatus Thorarchaeota archaeon]|nr:hypothetical protein [Candidatus Thorarchaeota archaeon]